MPLRPVYRILENTQGTPLVIEDIGHKLHALSITNGAEYVVEDLIERGLLPEGRKLFYYDSNDDYAEILIKDGQFAGFKF
jgi:hypothetical protein